MYYYMGWYIIAAAHVINSCPRPFYRTARPLHSIIAARVFYYSISVIVGRILYCYWIYWPDIGIIFVILDGYWDIGG